VSADPAVHLHELRCPACGLELGAIHRRDDADQSILGYFYPPRPEGLTEADLAEYLRTVQVSGSPGPCPRCGGAVHEGCLVADLHALTPRRARKRGGRARPPESERGHGS
jgi:hypothetical protein